MLNLENIKKGLEITPEDKTWMKEMLENPVNQNRNTIISLMSDYVFECQTCKHFMGRDSIYHLTKKEIGLEMRETLISDVRTTEGIFLLKDLVFKPDFSSILNHVSKEGYVCDHCMISVYGE